MTCINACRRRPQTVHPGNEASIDPMSAEKQAMCQGEEVIAMRPRERGKNEEKQSSDAAPWPDWAGAAARIFFAGG
ncbi:MAG: hypothetical protein IJI03_09875 [Rudaea sp.]|uniref:hypothetical protein n=1 Tax=unclassified Rudaea TaxID=2627037 RepID=UPI001BB1E7C6|nr:MULTISPECIES: hypothetical protein [unclassified Rudaea]MBR0345556.1 hypothetical protein [Rudaea sp.]